MAQILVLVVVGIVNCLVKCVLPLMDREAIPQAHILAYCLAVSSTFLNHLGENGK